jgi:hypothetical protein
MKTVFFILFFSSFLAISQKQYFGFDFGIPLFHHASIGYDVLSDSPLNNQDLKILNKKPFNLSFSDLVYDFEAGLNVHYGFQYKYTFFDLALTPINFQHLSLKTEYPQGQLPDENGYYLNNSGIVFGAIVLSIKQNVTGRSLIKIIPSLGYGIMVPYSSKFEKGQQYFELDKFAYQIAQPSLMILFKDALKLEVKYNYMIDKFSPEVSFGFIEFTFGGQFQISDYITKDRVYFGE